MSYEIKGGTSDKLEQATITKQVSYEDIKKHLFPVDSLEADTVYYFWIRAIAPIRARIESEYSNPLVIKTQAHKPAPPTGFGVDHNGSPKQHNLYME